jgi:two-component system sensor kinase
MGIVYRAFDPVHDRQVALKILPSLDPALLSRFKREFRVLVRLDHPNVVRLFELNSDGESWFFTMEIVEGVDLLNYVGQGFVQPDVLTLAVNGNDALLTEEISSFELSNEGQQRLRDAFGQLAEAIAALHAIGVVHRDIKPSNVIVTRDGRVVLLDFGLVAETDPSGLHHSVHQHVMGTAAFMSPEQAACEPVSTSSDLYSVGVMLYQALTGRLPFAGKTLEILVEKQKRDPLPPCEIASFVSQGWNDLCVDLLCRSPESRPVAEDILKRLGRRTDQDASTKAAGHEVASLVGRESQLQSLRSAWQAVRDGQARFEFIEGGSGNGKSALVEAFLDQATREGAAVLRGRCYEMESVPFKAVDSLVDSLVEHLTHLSPADAAALMPRDVHALARLFAVIGQIEAVASLPRRQSDFSDQKELNRRAIGALRELLARMGDRYPLVVYIDDLQWGDEDSAAMLSDLLQPPDQPVLLFLGTYRSEDTDTSQFLQSFRQIQHQRECPIELLQLDVTPLQHSDAVKLALALLRRDDADAQRRAESIAREAAGNPFFVTELVKHVQLDGGRVSKPTEPSGLADMIWSRVQRLPDESQRLLAVVALGGHSLPLNQAMRIAGVGQLAVGPLRAGHLIRTVGLASSPKIETYHDRIRESVAQRLDHATKQQQHLRIAEDYARQSPLDTDTIMDCLSGYFPSSSATMDNQPDVAATWYDIAFHFDAAGQSHLGFAYALAAAEKSRTQFSLEVAEQQYRIAERGVEGHDDAVRCRVAEGLADVLMLRGNYDEARSRFDHALELDADSVARIEAKLGELAFKQGDMEKAIEIFERVLELLGHQVPGRTSAIYFQLAREAFVQVLHSLRPKLFVARKKFKKMEKPLLVMRLHNRLAYAYFFERLELCLWSHLRGMNLAEQYPPTVELAHAYSSHGPAMGLVAFFSRGLAYSQKSLAMYRSLGDLWGQGQALCFHGVVFYAASRFEECIEKCREAVKVLERAGDLWEVNVARLHTAFSIYRLGDLVASTELAKRVHFSGVELGDAKASGFSLDVWAWSTGGKVPAEILQTELQRPREDVQVSAQVMMAEGVRLFMLDRVEEAADFFEKGHQLAEAAGLRNTYVLPLRSWLASALRRQAQKTSRLEPKRRTALLKRAGKVGRKAVRVAQKFQNDLPHALREAGLISAMQGSHRRARKYLDESLDVAQRQGARFEHAQTLLARGSVGLKLGWSEAEDEVAAARQALIEMGADFALEHIGASE